MKLNVRFAENEKRITTNFGEVHNISDGGYERGLAEGKAEIINNLTDLVATANGEYTPEGESTGFNSVSVAVAKKLPQVTDRTVTEITAEDLQGAKVIGDYAFTGCASLYNLTLPNGIESIGEEAFSGCKLLPEVRIPASVKQLGKYSFADCGKLKVFEFENNSQLESIGDRVFYGSREVQSIVVPDTTKTIGSYAFYNGNGLQTVTIGASVESIGGNAFNACWGLATVIMKPRTPPTIQATTFQSGYSARQYIVPIGCGEAYRTATNWSAYASNIVEGDV